MAIDWNGWPQRALDQVFDLMRRTLLDGMQDLESRRLRVDRIAMGRGVTEFWRAKWRNQQRYRERWHGDDASTIDDFYGARIIVDALMDRRPNTPGVFDESDIRLITAGYGSHRCSLRTMDDPASLAFIIQFVGHTGSRSQHRYGYHYLTQMINYDDRMTRPMPEMVAQQSASMDQQERIRRIQLMRDAGVPMSRAGVVSALGFPPEDFSLPASDSDQADIAIPPPPIFNKDKPVIRKEMSPMRIAWLT